MGRMYLFCVGLEEKMNSRSLSSGMNIKYKIKSEKWWVIKEKSSATTFFRRENVQRTCVRMVLVD